MQLVCFVDLDGVLVDFVGPALRLHGKDLAPLEVRWNFPEQVGFTRETLGQFWDALDQPFWRSLPWTHEGRDLLRGVEAAFADRVSLLSSPCLTPGCLEGKREWIDLNLPREYGRRYLLGAPKHLVAGPGKVLIDDHEEHVDRWVARGGVGVLVPRPWNRRRAECDLLGHFDAERFVREEIRPLGWRACP